MPPRERKVIHEKYVSKLDSIVGRDPADIQLLEEKEKQDKNYAIRLLPLYQLQE